MPGSGPRSDLAIAEACKALEQEYGYLGWWPAQQRFEILVGAVLVQNTAWSNAVRAIDALRDQGLLDAEAILATKPERLATMIRPSGYFNVKSRRLFALCQWFVNAGGFAALEQEPTQALRAALLSVRGIGPETADDILLYAFDRPVFVIDAYTRRLFGRLGLIDPNSQYEELRSHFESALHRSVPTMQNTHAVIVEHGKQRCRPNPHCDQCCLHSSCGFVVRQDKFE